MSPPATYTLTARLLHWLMAVLILVTLPAGLLMTRLPPGSWQDRLFVLHKGLGPIILLLLVLRAVWRLTHAPPPLEGLPPGQRRVAHIVHLLLYLVLAVMAVSGYVLTVAGGYPIELLDRLGIPPLLPVDKPLAAVATGIHLTVKFAVILLVVGHIAAALRHWLLKRDGVMGRMSLFR